MGCNDGDPVHPGDPLGPTDQQAQEAIEDEHAVVRIYFDSRDELNALAGENAPWEVHHDQGYAIFEVHGQAEIEELRSIGYRVEIDQAMTDQLHAPAPDDIGLVGIPGYSCYRTVEETYAAAAAIVASHPTLATWTDIGNSWKKNLDGTGYDINVLRLTNTSIPGPKPVMFVMGAIHAREYTTAETVTRFAEHLVNNYGVNADITWLLDYHEFHLVLQSNPDGRKFAEGGQLWRKNTNQAYCGATSSSRGADLNRNYPYEWVGSGSSTAPCSETYRGASPGSEPETQAITAYVRSIFPDQRDESLGPNTPAPANATGIFFDIHSYSELVLWPWGYTTNNSPNHVPFQTLGRKMAYFNDYMPQRSVDLYVTNGTTDDFAYGELGVAAYTIELGTAFFQSCSSFESTVYPDNLAALMYAAKVARTPYRTPAGPDALNVAVSAPSVVRGQPVTISAQINDGRFSSNNGIEPTQAVAGADVYLGLPPWAGSPVTVPMVARDGTFNATIELADATIDTNLLPPGRHLIYVEGRDALGNRGPVSARFLEVLPGSSNQLPTTTITSPADTISVREGTPVALAATASDVEDGNLTASIVWTSSISGQIATGGSATVSLPVGTHTITASATDSGSATGNDSTTVVVTPAPVFEANFDSGAAGWTTSGLWHLVTSSTCASPESGASSPPNAMYYGQNATCNYDVGVTTSGNLTSPVITGVTSGSVLSFNYFRRVESSAAGYDVTAVDVLAGTTVTTVFSRNSTNPST
ncbi:MAG TPA: M14 family zinc carboxypeptidase, partial [Haliangium sp.]|nr:M14 family zinc carboxypeptidase [Haliangium sp.]